MSALQQLLSQHSADINARIQHTNDIDNEISERKANTLEEKFQSAKDAIESAGAELGTAGGAFHLGRKVYTKYKQRQARLAKEKTSGGDSASSESAERPGAEPAAERPAAEPAAEEPVVAADEEPLGGLKVTERPLPGAEPERPTFERPTGGDQGKAATGETDEAAPEPAPEGGRAAAEPREDLGSIEEEPELTGGLRTQAARQDLPSSKAQERMNRNAQERQAQTDAEAKDPETHTQPKPSESQPAQDTSDPATAEGQQSRAATVESNQAEAPTGTEEANPMDALNTRTATPLQAGGSEPTAPATSEANVGSAAEGAAEEGGARSATAATTQAGGSTAADVEEGARAFMDPATGAAKSAANIASRAADNSSIIDKGINGAKKVGSAIKGGLGGDLSEGSSILPEVGEALDFLGPIGEFAGLITGLVGLFEGIGHKKAEPKTISGQSGGVALQQAGGGIDTSALLSQAPKALMGAV